MAAPVEDRLSVAVKALYRIEGVEKPPDDDGLREVWHHCAQGADLISTVDRAGHVERQELTLLDDFFLWTSGEGLCSGLSSKIYGSKGTGPTVELDRELASDRVQRAASAMAGYTGLDRYLLHIKQVIDAAAQGAQLRGRSVVTRSVMAYQPKAAAPAKRELPRWLLPVCLAGLVLAAGLYFALLR